MNISLSKIWENNFKTIIKREGCGYMQFVHSFMELPVGTIIKETVINHPIVNGEHVFVLTKKPTHIHTDNVWLNLTLECPEAVCSPSSMLDLTCLIDMAADEGEEFELNGNVKIEVMVP